MIRKTNNIHILISAIQFNRQTCTINSIFPFNAKSMSEILSNGLLCSSRIFVTAGRMNSYEDCKEKYTKIRNQIIQSKTLKNRIRKLFRMEHITADYSDLSNNYIKINEALNENITGLVTETFMELV